MTSLRGASLRADNCAKFRTASSPSRRARSGLPLESQWAKAAVDVFAAARNMASTASSSTHLDSQVRARRLVTTSSIAIERASPSDANPSLGTTSLDNRTTDNSSRAHRGLLDPTPDDETSIHSVTPTKATTGPTASGEHKPRTAWHRTSRTYPAASPYAPHPKVPVSVEVSPSETLVTLQVSPEKSWTFLVSLN